MNRRSVFKLLILTAGIILFISFSGCLQARNGDAENIIDTPVSPEESQKVDKDADNITPADSMAELTVTSPGFEDGDPIPAKYTCDGEDINPELNIADIPDNAVSLLLIMDDPDAPSGTFTHWLVWNISLSGNITENSIPGAEGLNSAGRASYTGPCPPSGTHRYFFKIYALDTKLELSEGSEREIVENAMEGHVIGYGQLMGTFREI